jgi:hypothetical protein
MNIHNCAQGSPEWDRLRALNFTASGLDSYVLEPVKVTLSVDQIRDELDARGIIRKGITRKDDLLALLPNKEQYLSLCQGARTAILKQIKSEKMQAIRDNIAKWNAGGKLYEVTKLEDIMLSREEEMMLKESRSFEYNIPVKYGKLLEPYARDEYERLTGHSVEEVGFIEHESGGFGCSPDGLIRGGTTSVWHNGLEIKCPLVETHLGWLLDGGLPDEHFLQVHACMAVTGLRRWDFLSFCPGEKTLLVSVEWSDETSKIEEGLKTLVREKDKIKQQLAKQ